MTKSEMSYVIAGGGTGGHVFPALALAGEIRKRRPGARIVFVGTVRGLETTLVPKAGYPLETIRVKGLVGKGLADRLSGAMALPLGCADSWRLLSRHAPNAVVGVGGYASGPVVATAAARRHGDPRVERGAGSHEPAPRARRDARRLGQLRPRCPLRRWWEPVASSSRPRRCSSRPRPGVFTSSSWAGARARDPEPARAAGLAALRAEGLESRDAPGGPREARRGFDAADLERVYAAAGFGPGTVASSRRAPSAFAADVSCRARAR
jgi:hypothetical protein